MKRHFDGRDNVVVPGGSVGVEGSLPGGRIETGETALAALTREMHEELGADRALRVGEVRRGGGVRVLAPVPAGPTVRFGASVEGRMPLVIG